MHIVILGGGIIGITTAWELLADDHTVTLVERRPAVAAETSHANGGQISPSHADPWATPDAIWRGIRWMFTPNAPLRLMPRFDTALFGWLGRFAANCDRRRHAINTERMARLALYSRDRLQQFNDREKLAYNRRCDGLLHVFRDRRALHMARAQAERITELGIPRLPVSPSACVAIEPALKAVAGELCGGYHAPEDESGDARLFARRLARLAQKKGLILRLGEHVNGVVRDARVRAIRLANGGEIEADAVVCALGAYATPFMRDLGVVLPVQPAKGYSITVPAQPARAAPKVALIDDERKLVVSRLGGKVRIAGTAEFSGFNTSVPGPRPRLLARQGLALLPGLEHHAGKGTDLRFWAGLRPQTPDGVPVIGTTPVNGLYINTGHGTLGWTMAMGSARLLADLVSGHAPALPMNGYALNRF